MARVQGQGKKLLGEAQNVVPGVEGKADGAREQLPAQREATLAFSPRPCSFPPQHLTPC